MIVCEYEVGFNYPDRDNPEYAFAEVDVFAQNPAARARGEKGNYRLSMRRNLAMGRWELFRSYYEAPGVPDSEVIEATGTLAEVCDAANRAWAEAWGHVLRPGEKGSFDEACDHVSGSSHCARRCPGRPQSSG
jgi:hypothetical protein